MKKHFFSFILALSLLLLGVYYFAPETVEGLIGKPAPAKKTKKKKAKAEKPAPPLSFPDAGDAREQAKADNKPFLIIWHATDWMNNGNAVRNAWIELSTAGEPLPVIFGQFDEQVGTTEDVRKKAAMPFSCFNLPIAILFAPDGTFVSSYRGKTVRSATVMHKEVKAQLANLPQFMELVKQARESTGEASATAAGKALELIPHADACRHPELTKFINERDPEDKTGYRSKFCIDHIKMYGLINAKLKGGAEGKLSGKERKFDEAEAYVNGVISRQGGTQPELATEQKQQWLAGLYYVQKERMNSTEKKDRTEVLATLKKIIELDPKSEYGVGADAFHRYWDPESVFEVENGFYEARHQTLGFDKDWHIDVTDIVKTPGTYVVTRVPMVNGSMTTRNFRIVADGKEIARPAIDEKQGALEVEITVPELPKNAKKIELWLTAQCHDGWLNCSGRLEVKKK